MTLRRHLFDKTTDHLSHMYTFHPIRVMRVGELAAATGNFRDAPFGCLLYVEHETFHDI